MLSLLIGWTLATVSAPGAKAASAPTAFESVTLEAEQGALAGATKKRVEGASKDQAVLLAGTDAALTLSLTLPAGAYSVQVRAKAKDPDTFNEVLITAGGQALRPIYPTNPVFTRMKGHFQRTASGKVDIRLTLKAGSGVYVDQVRVFRQDLDYRFKQLRPLHLTTTLAEAGKPLCQIVLPDDGSCRDVAARLAEAIAKRCGAAPAIRPSAEIKPADFQRRHLVLLGDTYSNVAILRTSPRTWAHVRRPEQGAFDLMTIHNPLGTGKNVVVVGGRDAGTIAQAADELIRRLPDGPTVTIPRIWLPPWPKPMPREKLKQLMVDSGRWIRQGAIRTLQNRWKAKGIEGFRLLGYRYIEYKESADTITQRRDDGFSDAEFYKVISAWDRFEEDPYFTDAERLELTDAMWRFLKMCIDPFGRYVAGGHHLELSEIAKRVRAATPTIRHNHQTFPATSFQYAADYFGTYHDLPEAKDLRALAKIVFDGQRPCAKPQCDCSGYQTITMAHMVRHAVSQGDWDYVNSPQVRQFLRLKLISRDNQGMPVGYGDSGGYIGEPTSDPLPDVTDIWVKATAGRFDSKGIAPPKPPGVYVHPLDRHWHGFWKCKAPLARCFDKIVFRGAKEPNRAYLLLDGLSRGYHGHWDGNSILRFTDNGRVWLGEGDYLNGDLKDHNTVTIVKDGLSGRPPLCSTLVGRADLPGFGATCTRTDDYCGATWDRHLLWRKPADLFVLIDRVTAKSDGTYDVKCRFRTFGQVRHEGRSIEVTQAGGERFNLHAASECRLRLSDDPRDGEKNWSKYPHAEPVTRLIVEQTVRRLKAGESHAFVNLMYASGSKEDNACQVLPFAPGVAVMRGKHYALVGIDRLKMGDQSVVAREFWIGAEGVYATGVSEFMADEVGMRAKPPIDVAWTFSEQGGTLHLAKPAKLSFTLPMGAPLTIEGKMYEAGDVGEPLVIDLPAGTHNASIVGVGPEVGIFLGMMLESAFQSAKAEAQKVADEKPGDLGAEEAWRSALPASVTVLRAADLDGDGTDEVIAGGEDGTLQVLGADGRLRWSHRFAAKVNDACAVDLDGDGRAEVVAGVEDERVHAISAPGKTMWSHHFEPYRQSKAHARVVHAADFDRDGTPEVAVGCANSYFYVLDNHGKLRVDADGSRWEMKTYHQASAIDTSDVDGDGHLELLAGCTYFARYIVSFHKRRWQRYGALSGCISGCGSIATSDVDGDGHAEAIFADMDGRIAAAEKGEPYKAKVVWERFVGDDEITRVCAGDLDGDNKPDLLAASRSGFVARLSATDGKVAWLRYGQGDMTDVAMADVVGDAGREAIAANLDGCVYVHDATGKPAARRQLDGPVRRLATARVKGEARSLIVAAVGEKLVAIRCR